MEIQQIKQALEITAVAEQLGIKIDARSKRALCPFHNDKTPSLQFSKEKQIATCFSSNCNAGTMDVIGLTEKKLQKTTHETLKYLQELIVDTGELKITPSVKQEEPRQFKDVATLKKVFSYFETAFLGSKPAKDYATSRNLNIKTLTIGYNTGTFHHGEKSQGDSQLIEASVQLGLLHKTNSGYAPFGLGSLVFALKDKQNQVTGIYFRAVEPRPSKFKNRKYEKHLYLKNRTGLYPKYPEQETKKLILTESIIDAATLLSIAGIKSKYEVLALYGTNGLTAEIKTAIVELENLEEVILWFDGDEAGIKAKSKQGFELSQLFSGQKKSIKIFEVLTPKDEDINSLLDGHEPKILTELLKEKQVLFYEYPQQADQSLEHLLKSRLQDKTSEAVQELSGINTNNPNKIVYITETAAYYIKGGIRKDLDSLRVTLVIEHLENKAKSRNKLDLYEDKQTEKIARESAERLNLRADLIEQDLNILTDLLDQYREESTNQTDDEAKKIIIPKETKDKCYSFLKKPKLLQNINELIGKSGVVGEEKNRLFLFGIASTYKMESTLHALIQGTSGSGKTHLLVMYQMALFIFI